MDKNTVYILVGLAAAAALVFVATRGTSQSPAPPPFEAETPPSSGAPVEQRVISATESLYRFGRQVYDDVRARQQPGAGAGART